MAAEDGTFVTPTLETTARTLALNVDAEAGEVRVAVERGDGTPFDGRAFDDCAPVAGDAFNAQLTWRGEQTLAPEWNGPIVLRFQLRDARVFGLEFGA